MEAKKQIENWKEFIQLNYYNELLEKSRHASLSLNIDFGLIVKFSPEFADLILEQPEDLIKAGEIASCEFDLINKQKDFTLRFYNLPKDRNLRIRDIRTKHLGQLWFIEADIRRTSEIRPLITSIRFECPNCSNIIPVLQKEDKYVEPNACGCGRKGKFIELSRNMIDSQKLLVQEQLELMEGTEQPKQFHISLFNNLCSKKMDKVVTPGTRVRITGILKDIPLITKSGSRSTTQDLVMHGNYIQPMNNDKINLSISKDDEEKIKKLSHDELLIDKMVASCAPDIYGYEDIKLAILLQLFGGVRKMEEDGKLKRRGDFHILIIGDPGAGKSKLLKGAMKIAPKSQYSTGPSSSGKGMTAIVSRDELTGGWYVEAGALVLANNGLHIQDEVDKTGKDDMHYLHEALEEQTISIHKGGIHTQLITHTSLLAGGNPKHSRFSNFETVAEQINLEPSFISRFDLIFTIKDKPDKTRDDLIINRILDVHLNIDTIRPEIDSLLLKKYITYAREHYKPIISSVAREKVREIYHILRGYNKGDSKTIAITTRIGEGLIRISEAAAKMRLSDIIEKRDVELAEKIIMASLKDIALDPETGKLDIDRIDTNMSSSKRNDMYTILNLLKNSKEPILIEDIIEHCAQKGMNDLEVERMVEKLNFTGEIVEHVRGKGYVIMK